MGERKILTEIGTRVRFCHLGLGEKGGKLTLSEVRGANQSLHCNEPRSYAEAWRIHRPSFCTCLSRQNI